ncbi:MAG: secretin N-terminal domain-containing protein [Candidatus Omnitrophota bacterium]
MRRYFLFRSAVALMILGSFFAIKAYSVTDIPESDGLTRKPISGYSFPGLHKKISVDVREMDIAQFLKFLASEGNLNIITSKAVTGPVSLLINEVTIGDVLELALAMNGFAYQVKGNVITVMTNAESKTLFGVEFYDQRKTAIYQLKYASPKNVAAILGNIKSEVGKIVFDDSTGTLILIDTPGKVKEMDAIIQKQELPTVSRVLPTEVQVYEFRYAKVETIKDEISKVLTPEVGSMRTDIRTNTLVVTDLPHVLKKVDVLVNAFDRKIREVFIDAKIVEVTLNDKFQWGIDWSRVITVAGKFSAMTIVPQAAFPLLLDKVTGMGKMTVSTTSSKNKLDVVLEALESLAETRVLSNPHITVEEGKEAKVEVIEKQPYEEDTTTTATGGTVTNAKSYQWVEIGVSLSVTPHINQDGFISMVIKPVMSSISAWYGGEPQAAGAVPVVKSANAQTTVTIKDGVTIIIAGLVKDNKTKRESKIPVLGDIPWLGMAFKRINDEVSRTETIVFLTPRIVTGEESFLLEKDRPKPLKGIRK